MSVREGVFAFASAGIDLNTVDAAFKLGWPGGRGRIKVSGTGGASATVSLSIEPDQSVTGVGYAPIAAFGPNQTEYFEAPKGRLGITIQNGGSSPALALTEVDIQPAG